jgi:hypothetical protein
LPRVRHALGLDTARLRGTPAVRIRDTFVSLSFELMLFDLFLFERQDVLHGLFLRACGDDLFVTRGLGRRHGPSQQIAAGCKRVRSVPRNDALEQLNDLTPRQ